MWLILEDLLQGYVNGIELDSYDIFNHITERKMSSFLWNFHHWLHWKLSFWQLPVEPGMKNFMKITSPSQCIQWFFLGLLHWHWDNPMPQCQWSNSEENHWIWAGTYNTHIYKFLIWVNRLCDSTEPQWYNHYKTKQNKNLVNFYGIYCTMPVLFICVSLMWWCD